MRAWLAALILALPLIGCVTGDPEPPEGDVRAVVTSLAVPACVEKGQAFDVLVTVQNLEPRAGSTVVMVDAQQFGHIVNERVHLEPNETRDIVERALVAFTGPWRIFVSAPDSRASDAQLRVVEPPRAC